MNCLLWVNPNHPLVSYENGFISVLSNRVPIVAVLSALAAVVLHRVADLSFRVVGIKEKFRARVEATHPPVAFRIEQIEIRLEEQ
ncbi:hypothetical protein [Bacillus sp. BB56-3]|uniref:hypothetical protein n=1 Tax=Bacillus sp. BB56-3 TaxID=2217831 RepID=UPI0021079B37|nr:hypothetical protein [Bacillus sp. BB56-3]